MGKTEFTRVTEFLPNTTYNLTIENATDLIGNVMETQHIYFTTWADYDGDGSPDSEDLDDDEDGVPDTEDAFPFDPDETIDTDSDGIGNNADTDDDDDGVPDIDDYDSLNPDVSEDPALKTNNNLWIYILIILAIVGVVGVIVFLKFKGKPKMPEPLEQEEGSGED
ncbi:MAG: hypothetical protein KAJ33_08450 [Thermoplasmata archaeon]|nr:hypothetical protein [Thermoplasmata archaeon]